MTTMFFKKNKEAYDVLLSAADYLSKEPKVEQNPWPVYDERVMKVFALLKTDEDYMKHYEKIKDKPVENMTLKEIGTMYTFISRGEKFSDGFIAANIEDGTMYRLVSRHMELTK